MRNESTLEEVTEQTFCHGCRLVPVSHLGLDLDVPIGGWERFLSEQGIDVQADDLGRPAIARSVFGALVREQASMRKLLSERAALRAAEAAEIERRTRVPVGIPAQEGLSALETVMAAPDYQSPRDEFGNPRVNWIAELIEGDARRRTDEEQVQAKERLAKQMKERLG